MCFYVKVNALMFRLMSMFARVEVKEIDGGYFQAVEHVV